MMKKSLVGIAAAFVLLAGSGMTAFAAEPEGGAALPGERGQTYQPAMTPEILESFARLKNVDDVDGNKEVLMLARVLRTDFGELCDADGDGIDDRDPINGCGYLDRNYNGFDDRFEAAAVSAALAEEPLEGRILEALFGLFTHKCPHGVVDSRFEYDEDWGCYWSLPGNRLCPEREADEKALNERSEAAFSLLLAR